MQISQFLKPEAVFDGLNAADKKSLLFEMAKKAERFVDLDVHTIYERMVEREKLGSTAIGQGVAIPHIRDEQVGEITGCFFRLKNPVRFDALDEEPVDLLFFLITPARAGADHLQALSRVSRALKDSKFCQKLRKSAKPEEMFMLFTATELETLAA